MRIILYYSILFGLSQFALAISEQKFELYKPGYTREGFCDKGVELTLMRDSVILKNFVKGVCDLYVPPNVRKYKIQSSSKDRCGTEHYIAKRNYDDETYTLKITDHRKRVCEDFPASKIIVIEEDSYGNGVEMHLPR